MGIHQSMLSFSLGHVTLALALLDKGAVYLQQFLIPLVSLASLPHNRSFYLYLCVAWKVKKGELLPLALFRVISLSFPCCQQQLAFFETFDSPAHAFHARKK